MNVMQDSVKSLMSSNVISVLPETSIITAIDIILSNNFNGVPVADKTGILVGIITKYDLIVKRDSVRDDMTVKEVMNKEPLVLQEDVSLEDAVRAFSEHHRVDPIPVINKEQRLVGIISRYDLVKLFREYGINFTSEPNTKTSAKNNNPKPLFWVALLVFLGLGIALLYVIYWG